MPHMNASDIGLVNTSLIWIKLYPANIAKNEYQFKSDTVEDGVNFDIFGMSSKDSWY